MPFEKGKSGNPEGKRLYQGVSPKAQYADEPEAPQLLRDMRWVYCTGKSMANATNGQKAVKSLLDADAARFLAMYERAEADWKAEKEKKAAEARAAGLPSQSPDSAPVPLDDVSRKIVDQIDRWLENHRKEAESLRPPSSSEKPVTT